MHHLSRRGFVQGASAIAAGLPLLSSGCSIGPFLGPRPRIPRIGYLTVGPRETCADLIDAFLQGLRELGYLQDQTVTIEWRFWSDGGEAELSRLADDLVQSAVNIMVIEGSTQVAEAAMRATTTIPIVAINVTLPVQTGVVTNLGQPSGNVTALASSAPGIASKKVELLREIVPGLARLVAFVDPANPSNVAGWRRADRPRPSAWAI
jgi:putative ABC transport system substrate-binding protein